ncbi:hypothetical protein K435DRAFT_760886 [Dendrothele bispora CBS 962.96]|uniref:Nephrocystin 3-like N-terminal domain-containing protein n=1 Tax=Dendrothele bispora (strain CBS 962.96) TaxID=1314807 RepID=A0A4S8LKR7_DENBC|nr:hypothetical protein K435DRAFT_760886 [Dendrothele bispora CBS 962.96]
MTEVLQDLRKALTATSDKAVGKECHPGTCETVVSRVIRWITNSEENRNIFWLRGPPSSGKTSVVTEVIKRVTKDNAAGVVVSDFLCTRVISESGHTEDIIPTLAATLADRDRSYRRELCRYLETMTTQTVLNKTPPEQVKDLFITPLQKLGSMKRVLLVIDSLEECSPEHSSYQSEAEAQIRDLLEGFRVHARLQKISKSSSAVDRPKPS